MGDQRHTIAVVGGTGPQGKGLAYRFARHGHDVVIGSRSAERASEVFDVNRVNARACRYMTVACNVWPGFSRASPRSASRRSSS